jgi:hypothetical protein
MRMRVTDVLSLLAGGMTEAEILVDYEWLELEDIRACLAYAAEAVDHPVIALPPATPNKSARSRHGFSGLGGSACSPENDKQG